MFAHIVQLAETTDLSSVKCEFESLYEHFGWIAKWPNAPDCKSGGSTFEGSNPSPSINSGVLSSDDQEMKTSPWQEEMLVNSVGVVERLITLDLKSRGCNRSEGSNPSAYVLLEV